MISDPTTAKYVGGLMLLCLQEMRDSIDTVKKTSSPEEALKYTKAVGLVAFRIVYDVLEPLYAQHPELKPPKWDGWGADVGA